MKSSNLNTGTRTRHGCADEYITNGAGAWVWLTYTLYQIDELELISLWSLYVYRMIEEREEGSHYCGEEGRKKESLSSVSSWRVFTEVPFWTASYMAVNKRPWKRFDFVLSSEGKIDIVNVNLLICLFYTSANSPDPPVKSLTSRLSSLISLLCSLRSFSSSLIWVCSSLIWVCIFSLSSISTGNDNWSHLSQRFHSFLFTRHWPQSESWQKLQYSAAYTSDSQQSRQ